MSLLKELLKFKFVRGATNISSLRDFQRPFDGVRLSGPRLHRLKESQPLNITNCGLCYFGLRLFG